MSKLALIVIVVIVIIAGAALYWWYGAAQPSVPMDYGQTQTPQDETAEVGNELQAIQTEGLDAELQDIEKEITQ